MVYEQKLQDFNLLNKGETELVYERIKKIVSHYGFVKTRLKDEALTLLRMYKQFPLLAEDKR